MHHIYQSAIREPSISYHGILQHRSDWAHDETFSKQNSWTDTSKSQSLALASFDQTLVPTNVRAGVCEEIRMDGGTDFSADYVPIFVVIVFTVLASLYTILCTYSFWFIAYYKQNLCWIKLGWKQWYNNKRIQSSRRRIGFIQVILQTHSAGNFYQKSAEHYLSKMFNIKSGSADTTAE